MPEKFTEIELRILELKVKKHSFWERLIERGKFEVKLLSVVSDGVPDHTFNLELGIFSVRDEGSIDFGPYGYALYRNRAGQIPRYLDCHIAVIEDNSGIRSMAKLMAEIRKTDDFKNLTNILALASINPAVKIGLNVAEAILNIGLNVLQQKKDKVWLRQYFTFNYKIDGYEGDYEFESDDVKLKIELITA